MLARRYGVPGAGAMTHRGMFTPASKFTPERKVEAVQPIDDDEDDYDEPPMIIRRTTRKETRLPGAKLLRQLQKQRHRERREADDQKQQHEAVQQREQMRARHRAKKELRTHADDVAAMTERVRRLMDD